MSPIRLLDVAFRERGPRGAGRPGRMGGGARKEEGRRRQATLLCAPAVSYIFIKPE